jgi:hypothetical protein
MISGHISNRHTLQYYAVETDRSILMGSNKVVSSTYNFLMHETNVEMDGVCGIL